MVLTEAAWQRCMVHWYRNVGSSVPKAKMKEVMAMLKAIHAQEDREAAEKKAADVMTKLESIKLGPSQIERALRVTGRLWAVGIPRVR